MLPACGHIHFELLLRPANIRTSIAYIFRENEIKMQPLHVFRQHISKVARKSDIYDLNQILFYLNQFFKTIVNINI